MKNPVAVVLAVLTLAPSCATDPLLQYKLADPGDPHDLADLPCILQLPPTEEQKKNLPPTRWWNYDEKKWFAEGKRLIGKTIDDVIDVYGPDYLVSLYRGRDEPRVYYHFAGTHSWGIYAVVVLDRNLRVKYVDTDPYYFENTKAIERYFGIELDEQNITRAFNGRGQSD